MLLCESAVVVFYLLLLDHTPQDWATILPQPRRDAVSHTFPRKFRDPASVRRKPGFFFSADLLPNAARKPFHSV